MAYLILPSNGGHLKNVIRYDEVNHGKIDNINEEKMGIRIIWLVCERERWPTNSTHNGLAG